jgi:hypothetical protein
VTRRITGADWFVCKYRATGESEAGQVVQKLKKAASEEEVAALVQ